MSVAAGSIYGRIEIDTGDSVQKVEAVGKAVDGLNGRGSEALSGLSAVEGRIKSLTDQADAFEQKWSGIGRTLTGIGAAIMSPIVAGAWAGWGQVGQVEQATLALRAYEKDASKVDAVLSGLLSYAQSDLGVLFSRQELFSAAQGLKIFGAETENLVDYVEIMSRSVGLGVGNWDELQRVIGRVGATGRLTGDDFDMLTKMGYQLDDSLRNTNVTWEELFTHLDAGMPADALAGQADTIRGKTIRLQSALRNLGLAFLGVEADTSKFIEGGLGDTFVKALTQGRQLLIDMQPAARALGGVFAAAGRGISALVDAFLKLPDPVRQFAATLVVGTGALSFLAGATLLLIPRILRFRAGLLTVQAALTRLGGLTGIIGRLGTALRALTLTNPLFWVLSAAVGAFLAYQNNFLGFRDAVNSLAAGFWNLEVVQRVREWVDGLMASFRSFFGAFGSIGGTQTVDIQVRGDDKKLQTIMDADGSKRYMIMGVQDDGSLADYGEIMESYLDENDPNIAHIRIVGEDGEYWSTIDMTTGEIGTGTIEVEAKTEEARSRVEQLQDGLSAMERTLRQRNMPLFAGIVSGLNRGITGVTRFGRVWNNAFSAFRQDGRNPVSAGLMAVRMALYDLSGFMGPFGTSLRSIGNIFGNVGIQLDNVVGVFQSFRNDGLSPVQAGVETLLSYLPNLESAVTSFGDAFSAARDALGHVGDAMSSFFDGSWADGFSSLRSAAEDGISGIVSAFNGLLDVAGQVGGWVINRLGDLGSRLWTWFDGQLSQVAWGEMFDSSISVLQDAGSWVAGKLGDAWTGISTWFTEQLSRVPWESIASASLNGLSSFGSWVVAKFSSATDAIQTWFSDQFGDVEWDSIATTGIDMLATSIGNAVSNMANIYTNILNWMTAQVTGVSWSSVGEKFGELLGIALKAAIGAIALSGKLLLQMMIEVGKVDWGTVASAFWGLLKAAALASLDLLNGIAEGLYNELTAQFGIVSWDELWAIVWGPIDAFIDGSIQKINTLIEALNRIPGVDIGTISRDEPQGSGRPMDVDSSGQGYYVQPERNDRGVYARPRPQVSREVNEPALEIGNLAGLIASISLLEQIADPAVMKVDGLDKSILSLDRSALLATPSLHATASAVPMVGQASEESAEKTGGAGRSIIGSFLGMQAGAVASMSALHGAVSSETEGARAAATGAIGGMASAVAGQMLGMQANSSVQAALMQSNATNSASTMASQVGSHTLGMRTAASLQMGLMASSAATSGSQMNTGLTGWMTGALVRIASTMASMVQTVRNAAGSGYDAGYYAGSMISQGFANGMGAYLGQIRAAGSAMVAAASAAVLAKAMISSPSRLFEQYGSYIGEGLEIGILNSIPNIGRAADRLFEASVPRLSYSSPYEMHLGGYYSPPPVQQVTVIDNTTHHETFVTLNDAQFAELLAAKDKANAVHAAMTDRNAVNQFGGRR